MDSKGRNLQAASAVFFIVFCIGQLCYECDSNPNTTERDAYCEADETITVARLMARWLVVNRHEPEFWIALFTIVLTLATILLWLSTRELSTAAKKQGEDTIQSLFIAHKAMRATERSVEQSKTSSEQQLRAYVWRSSDASKVNSYGIYADDNQTFLGYEIRAQSKILNSGKTPAHDVVVWSRLAVLENDLPDGFVFESPPQNLGDIDGPRFVVNPRSKHTFSASSQPLVSAEDHSALFSQTRTLYHWGRISYRDVFGQIRRSDFRLHLKTEQDVTKPSGTMGIWAYCDEGNEAD